jgi:hypothetical protein
LGAERCEHAGEAWQATKNLDALRRFGTLEVLNIECESCSLRGRYGSTG